MELIGIEHAHFLENFLPDLEDANFELSHQSEIFLMMGAVALAVGAWLLAKKIYKEKQTLPSDNVTGIQKLFVGKYFLDEVYEKYINNPDINLTKDLIWIMPMCGSRRELIEVGPAVAEICKKHGFKFSNRMHLQVWDKALKV